MKPVELDLPSLNQLRDLITAIAQSFGLAPAVVAAIMSRESGAGRLLGKNGCPPGTGDHGHGRGLMQIDDRFHKNFLALPDFWRAPAANLAYAGYLLHNNLAALDTKFPKLDAPLKLRAALAAYNAGLTRVQSALRSGKDVDSPTTGHDYSKDVLARADWLRTKGWE